MDERRVSIYFGSRDENTLMPSGEWHKGLIGSMLLDFLNHDFSTRTGRDSFHRKIDLPLDMPTDREEYMLTQADIKEAVNIIYLDDEPYLKALPPLKRFALYEMSRENNINAYSTPANNTYVPYTRQKGITIKMHELARGGDLESAASLIEKTKMEVLTSYYIEFWHSNITPLFYVSLRELIRNGLYIKQCICGQYFIPRTRKDISFCDNCRKTGALKKYDEKLKNDEYLKYYRLIYKRHHAYIATGVSEEYRKKKLAKLKEWRKQAKALAVSKTMSLDEFKAAIGKEL